MDGESSYESDISESWSLIDVNLKGEPIIVHEACSLENPEKSSTQEIHNSDTKFESSSQKVTKEINSDCDCIGKTKNFGTNLHCVSTEKELNSLCKEDNVEDRNAEDEKNVSWDSESIEIIDEEGIDRDADFNTCVIHGINCNRTDYSYDEESCYSEDAEYLRKDSCSFGVRKRKRQERLSKSCLQSDIKHFDEELNTESSADKKNNNDLQIQMYKSNKSLYSSYEINLRNVLISLSFGILFAGVTCIVISSFMGASDVDSASDDLIRTVKKLQMEKFALQSRLNRALVKKEINFQLEEFLKEKKSDCPVIRQLQATESQNMGSRFFTRLKNNSVLNSIEWLNKFQNFIENKQYPRMESIVDLNKVINYINNQVSFSNGSYKEIKLKRTEKVNEKILTILRKILTKLSSLQDNLEIWYQKLLKLINKLNNNFNKIFTEDKTRTGNGVPATRQDLFSIRWNRSPTKYNFDDKQSERKVDSVLLYKVPQLEKYYDKKKSNNSVEGEICRNNICKSSTRPTFTDKTFFSKRTEPKEKIIKTKSASENNYGKIKNKKNDKFYKGKRDHGNKKDVYNRKVGRKKEKNLHKLKKLSSQKAHDNRFEKIQPNVKNQKNNFDNLYNKRCNARKLKKNYSKKKKNFKNSKENIKAGKKILKKKSRFEKENIENFLGKTNERQKYKPRYSNQTGFWNFKWANGREKFRRHQTLGDWQFDRARARKFSRTSDGDWQFDRARARRELRNACPLDSWFVWFRQKRV